MEKGAKPIIGITCGDLNGIGIELIIKTFSDNRILDICTPVIFGSNKVINFYRKGMPEINFSYQSAKELNRLNNKQVNIFNCWEEDVSINPGQLTDAGGAYAVKSFVAGVQALHGGRFGGGRGPFGPGCGQDGLDAFNDLSEVHGQLLSPLQMARRRAPGRGWCAHVMTAAATVRRLDAAAVVTPGFSCAVPRQKAAACYHLRPDVQSGVH